MTCIDDIGFLVIPINITCSTSLWWRGFCTVIVFFLVCNICKLSLQLSHFSLSSVLVKLKLASNLWCRGHMIKERLKAYLDQFWWTGSGTHDNLRRQGSIFINLLRRARHSCVKQWEWVGCCMEYNKKWGKFYMPSLNECSTWQHFNSPTSDIIISLETLISQEHSLATVDMPLKPKAPKKSIKKQVSDMHRYCLYCKTHRDGHGFDKHQAACKIIWQFQHRQNHPPGLYLWRILAKSRHELRSLSTCQFQLRLIFLTIQHIAIS